jgi:hypothetical protein
MSSIAFRKFLAKLLIFPLITKSSQGLRRVFEGWGQRGEGEGVRGGRIVLRGGGEEVRGGRIDIEDWE